MLPSYVPTGCIKKKPNNYDLTICIIQFRGCSGHFSKIRFIVANELNYLICRYFDFFNLLLLATLMDFKLLIRS